MVTSTISDHFQRRAIVCLFTTVLMIIGLVIMRENAGFSGKQISPCRRVFAQKEQPPADRVVLRHPLTLEANDDEQTQSAILGYSSSLWVSTTTSRHCSPSTRPTL
jgi:hypothetical protein